MQVLKLQNYHTNTSFCAGKVILNGICKENFPHYDAIKEIAQKNEFDFNISKAANTKFIPKREFYIISAKKFFDDSPHVVQGIDCVVVVHNRTKETKLSEKLYAGVINSIANLADNIKYLTGTNLELKI